MSDSLRTRYSLKLQLHRESLSKNRTFSLAKFGYECKGSVAITHSTLCSSSDMIYQLYSWFTCLCLKSWLSWGEVRCLQNIRVLASPRDSRFYIAIRALPILVVTYIVALAPRNTHKEHGENSPLTAYVTKLGSPDISYFISTDFDRNQLLWPTCNRDLPAVASI